MEPICCRSIRIHTLVRSRLLSAAPLATPPRFFCSGPSLDEDRQSSSPKRHVDVLIAGGGLVGGALAAAIASNPLTRSTLSVAVVDPAPPPPPLVSTTPHPPSLRTSTITPSSAAFLKAVGVWERIPPHRLAPFKHMLVWDRPAGTPFHPPKHIDNPFAAAAARTVSLFGSPSAVTEKLLHHHHHPSIPTQPAFVKDHTSLGTIRFDAKDLQHTDALGYVVDNDTLRSAIFEQLQQLIATGHPDALAIIPTSVQSVSFFDPPSFATWEPSNSNHSQQPPQGTPRPRWPIVHLANGDTYSARLIVAADGARSRIRALAGFDWYLHSYDQTAVVANVTLDRPIHTAYQRFLSTGPVAMLPVASDVTDEPLANIIWTTTPTEAAALAGASDVEFIDELNMALHDPDDAGRGSESTSDSATFMTTDSFSPDDSSVNLESTQVRQSGGTESTETAPLDAIPRCRAVFGARSRFPLAIGHAPRYVDPDRRTVLVGDAAHNIHPLAGQGVNLGFADASALADAIIAAAAVGRDIGGEDGAPLMRYERDRVAANVVMLGTLHTIHALFSMHAWTPFNLARRVGVSALDSASPVKRLILRAMS